MNIRIILCEPSHPGNIGSTARVIKTMGMSQLYLIAPKSFPDPEAWSLAAGAEDILEHTVVFDTLEEALKDSHYVFGCSARKRTLQRDLFTPEQASVFCQKLSSSQMISIVFGNERRGLTNEQLSLCQGQIIIPTSKDYASINLAQAVQIISYVFMRHDNENLEQDEGECHATFQERQNLHEHMAKTLKDMSFFIRPDPEPTLKKLRCIFDRTRLNQQEVAMLRGIFSSMDQIIEKNNEQ